MAQSHSKKKKMYRPEIGSDIEDESTTRQIQGEKPGEASLNPAAGSERMLTKFSTARGYPAIKL